MTEQMDSCDVAIIGMAGRFPRAANLEEFWENLKHGVEGIMSFSDDELEVVMDPEDLRNPNLVKAKGVLDNVELFDAPFFNISTREAQIMDPQQRLFLESAWDAIESAGYDVSTYPGQIAVYAGVNTNTYLLSRLEQLGIQSAADYFTLSLANEKDHLATRVSYKLNLRGESIAVQTSCSTSLVAVHLACQSLLSGQCDMALAGGVSIRVPQKAGYFYQEGMIMSPDGHCRAFDARAQGTVPGHGVGIVVLKLLTEAIKDGDNVRAIIKGSAINNDGHLKMGYTAPSVEGQADVIAKALAIAGVDAETITYVEAHGTGTPLGDPIEIEALTRAFRQQTQRNGFCALGAVKSNIGHLDNAAGVAGLIKTVLALEHRQIPPTLHFEKPNPMIGFERTPFMPNAILKEWQANGLPRRAGVSSFGIGGTNVHVILEEAGVSAPAARSRRQHEIITLSAKTATAAAEMAEELAQFLTEQRALELADVAYTRNVGRQVLPHKRFVVARSIDEAIAGLRAPETTATRTHESPTTARGVVFMFPGQGTQTVGMARTLLDAQPGFAEAFAECCDLLQQEHHVDVRSLLYPAHERAEESAKLISQPQFALPLLFSVEYALSRLWLSWGIRPRAMIGHSFGEYVAACLAEVFTLPDALTLVVARGRLMQQLPPGAMIAVRLSEGELKDYLSEELAISAVNSPGICTASGPLDQIARLEGRLSERKVAYRRLEVPAAYHSSMVDAILPEFEAAVAMIKRKPPVTPYVSNVSGTWITAEEVLSDEYWSRQMRETVRFAAGLETLVRDHSVFVEIGSGQALVPLLKPHEKDRGLLVLASLSHSSSLSDEAVMLKSLGRLWQAEYKVDWSGFHRGERRRRLALPTYPFERQRYWIEAPGHKAFSGASEPVMRPVPDTPSAQTIAAPIDQVSPARSPLLGEYVAPRNEIEVTLARIWSEVLGQAQIGAEDNFFDLGGDSLLATQVYARVKQAFAIDISLAEMFEHQRIADLSQVIQAATQNGPEYESISPVSHDGAMQLSFAQEWFWLLDQFERSSAAYNLPSAVRLAGPLNVSVLIRSIGEIVRRHGVLRSVFREVDGYGAQFIQDNDFATSLIDLSLTPPSAREATAQKLLLAEVSRPFDLASGPIIRSSLIRLDESDHILAITIHHIGFDAWSTGILVKELMALYAAFAKGEQSPLAELPIQYADFAAWQRKSLSAEVLATQLAYWKKQLSGAPPVLELPVSRTRPEVPSHRGARQSVSLPASLSDAVRELARREEVTLFMLLLAALQTLLARLSGQDDISVGMPIAGRSRVELEGLIGCFINTLVLRTRLAPAMTFRDLLRKVRETTLQAYAHQDLPFAKLIAELKPERRPGHNPLYQVLLDVVNAPGPAAEVSELTPELTLSPVTTDQGTAKVDLILDVWDSANGIVIMAEYKTDLFDRETIAGMLRQFETLLGSIVAQPDARLSTLEIMSDLEKRQQMSEQNERAEDRRRRFVNTNPKAVVLS